MSDHAIVQHPRVALVPSIGKVYGRVEMRPLAAAIRQAADGAMDVLMLLAVILCIPFVILAIGIPVALVVQLLLQLGRLL